MLAAALAFSAVAFGQARPRRSEDIAWTTFVGGPGRSPQRAEASHDPGTIDLGSSSTWECGYGRIRHAAISDDDWSVQRVLACRRGDSTVSATASCRIRRGVVEESAASLSLGTTADTAHVTVTLSCSAR